MNADSKKLQSINCDDSTSQKFRTETKKRDVGGGCQQGETTICWWKKNLRQKNLALPKADNWN